MAFETCARRGSTSQRPELRRLQRLLLPREVELPGPFQAAWSCRPAGPVGGDLVAVSAPAADTLFLLVADAMGHGPAAAIVASALRATLHLAQQAGVRAPAELLTRLGATLHALFEETFVTAACCTLDARGTLTFAQAGHPAILVRTPRGQVRALSLPAPPLGMLPDVQYDDRQVRLAPGSAVLLYTDGVSDGLGDDPAEQREALAELFGQPCAVTPGELVLRIGRAARRGQRSRFGRQIDDRTVLAACYG
jgi:serine phosphatase RsbU (regulator of sigma subunit)